MREPFGLGGVKDAPQDHHVVPSAIQVPDDPLPAHHFETETLVKTDPGFVDDQDLGHQVPVAKAQGAGNHGIEQPRAMARALMGVGNVHRGLASVAISGSIAVILDDYPADYLPVDLTAQDNLTPGAIDIAREIGGLCRRGVHDDGTGADRLVVVDD